MPVTSDSKIIRARSACETPQLRYQFSSRNDVVLYTTSRSRLIFMLLSQLCVSILSTSSYSKIPPGQQYKQYLQVVFHTSFTDVLVENLSVTECTHPSAPRTTGMRGTQKFCRCQGAHEIYRCRTLLAETLSGTVWYWYRYRLRARTHPSVQG